MTRALRPRKSRPSYAAMAGFPLDDDDEAGPSTAPPPGDDDDSGSEFAPEPEPPADDADADDDAPDADSASDKMDVDDPEDDDIVFATPAPLARPTPKKTPRARSDAAKALPGSAPRLARASNRQMYALPTPSIHHRHRAVPLYTPVARVERLIAAPTLGTPPRIVLTNSFTHNATVADRAGKAWGYNVAPGPLWPLVEDRGWFKEAVGGASAEREAERRPRVYGDVRVKEGWEVLDPQDAARYLPTDTVATEEGNLKPPPPVPCSFGPIDAQTRVDMQIFAAHKMADFILESKAHVFNAGAPVWGLDWCPIHVDDREAREYAHYLAVAPFPSMSHSPDIGARVARPSYACIQIWTLRPAGGDVGEMRCEMVLCTEGGPAYDLRWCPLPAHDVSAAFSSTQPRKLGILAGTFGDGSLSIYAVPDPADIIPAEYSSSTPVFVRLEPLLRIELEETACWSLDWANSEVLAVGTTSGIIAVFDIAQALKQPSDTQIVPTHYLTVHQSAIRALAWVRVPSCSPSGEALLDADPTIIASGGYDGMECLTDIREGRGSVMNRTRDVINAMAFAPFAGGLITIDHENIVKAYSASPSMLGRGHTLLEPAGPVWSLGASDYHSQLAVGGADGALLTTNTLRSTRRSGTVPFFVHKVFQLDYSRQTRAFRMLESFLPQETQDRLTANRAARAAGTTSAGPPVGTGAWPREVGVHRVAWHGGAGPGAAGLLAAGTAAGLCRVDWLVGRWLKEKVPYGSVEAIRGEAEGEDVSSDD